MIDVDFADLVDFLGEDRHTRSILIYMENVGDPRRFMSAARASHATSRSSCSSRAGTAESARAALTHTGSMGGDDEVYGAAFREPVSCASRGRRPFHAAEVLGSRRLPSGPDVAIIANAGLGLMADRSLMGHGGRLAEALRQDDGEAQRCPASVLEPLEPR